MILEIGKQYITENGYLTSPLKPYPFHEFDVLEGVIPGFGEGFSVLYNEFGEAITETPDWDIAEVLK